jgi:hypothetical protein
MTPADFLKQFRANYHLYKESCCAVEIDGKFSIVPIDKAEGLKKLATFVVLVAPKKRFKKTLTRNR